MSTKLVAAFAPTFYEVVNESHLHHGSQHTESHFKIIVVTPQWTGVPRLQRHREVMACLNLELAEIHASSLHLFSPHEWAEKDPKHVSSPRCAGQDNNK